MEYAIKIIGSGTNAEIAKTLRDIAESLDASAHESQVASKGECEWEDETLVATITEKE